MMQILYGGNDVFSGISPVPLVSIESTNLQYGGKRWGNTKVITLQGTITGACNVFSDLVNKQKMLVSGFSQDFQNIVIMEDGTNVYEKDFVTIRSITFPNSKYYKIIPYTIVMNCFDSGEFWNFYGVTNPKREMTVEELANGQINVSYEVSAQGFNTSSQYNAIDNAISFVDGLTGISFIDVSLFTGFLNTGIPTPYCRVSLEKSINKEEGTYSAKQSYLYTPMPSGISSYQSTYQVSRYALYSVTGLKGEIIGCEGQSLSGLRAAVPTGIAGVSGNVLKMNISEDDKGNKITFDIEIGNDPEDDPYFEYDLSTKFNVIKGDGTVSLNGTVKSKRGNREQRLAKVRAFMPTLDEFYLSGICLTGYMEAGGLFPQFLRETSYSNYEDPDAAEIKVSFAMSDRQYYVDYSISLTPALPYYIVGTTCDSRVVVQDYNIYNFGTISIDAKVPSGETFAISGLYPTGYRILDSFSGLSNLGVYNFKQSFATYDYKFLKP